jgi:hypothetical protein
MEAPMEILESKIGKKSSRFSSIWKILPGYAIAVLCLIWVFHDVQVKELIESMATINWRWVAGAAVFLIVHIGTVIPSAPSNVGTYQFFTVVGLALFGVNKTLAASFSVVVFLILTIPLWAIGMLVFMRLGLSLKKLRTEIASLAGSTDSALRMRVRGTSWLNTCFARLRLSDILRKASSNAIRTARKKLTSCSGISSVMTCTAPSGICSAPLWSLRAIPAMPT